MSLNKAIEHNKEHREQYRGSKATDPTCRNHGGDYWAEENRTYKNNRREEGNIARLKESEMEVMLD